MAHGARATAAPNCGDAPGKTLYQTNAVRVFRPDASKGQNGRAIQACLLLSQAGIDGD